MVEKNLYVTYADGTEELLKDQPIKENPVAFTYQVKSDFPVDFQNPFLINISKITQKQQLPVFILMNRVFSRLLSIGELRKLLLIQHSL